MKVIIVVNKYNNSLEIHNNGGYYIYSYEKNKLSHMFEIKQTSFIEAFKEYEMFEIEVSKLSMENIFRELPELLL